MPSKCCKARRCRRRELEREILPARVATTSPGDLDALMAAGEVVWVGRERIGDRDGRVRCTWRKRWRKLLPPEPEVDTARSQNGAARYWRLWSGRGASSSRRCTRRRAAGIRGTRMDALWELVWAGRITNDTFHPVRSLVRPTKDERHARRELRDGPPGSPEFLRRLRARTRARQAQVRDAGRWCGSGRSKR